MIQSFTKFGYSYHDAGTAPTNLANTYNTFPVTVDSTNSTNSASFPDDCNIQSIEFEITALSTAGSVTMFLARDSAGDIPITNEFTQNVTVGDTTVTKAGAVFSSEIDYHFDGSVANTTRGTIYVVAKVDGGTPTANIRVNWRA
jgi:hypothetical protein